MMQPMSDFSNSGVEYLTGRGYQAPSCTQFSCFLSNRVGKLLELVEVFEGQYLVLAALTVLEATDHAVIRVVTSRSELAARLLQRNHIPYSETELLAVEVGSEHTMSAVCKTLLAAEISIHYAYPMLVRPRGKTVIAIHTDDIILAGQILRRKLFTLLGENDLGENATGSDPADFDPHG